MAYWTGRRWGEMRKVRRTSGCAATTSTRRLSLWGRRAVREHQLSLVRGKPYLRDSTKTGMGRPVHLLPEAVAALKAHRIRYLEERLRYAAIWNAAWRAEPRHE